MHFRFSRRSGAAWAGAVALAAVLFPATAPAFGSTAPAAAAATGWHINKTFASGSTIFSVSGAGKNDAWLAGQSASGALLTQRWNGHTWSAVPTPAGVTPVSDAVVAGSSATNAWAFADVSANTLYTVALRWNGRHWTSYKFANSSVINAAAVFSTKDAWAFGGLYDNSAAAYVRHFNGSRWTTVSTPIRPNDASAVSADDIWAVGQTVKSLGKADQVFAAAQWTHGSWHLKSLPKLKLPAGVSVTIPYIVALSASNVWVDFALSKGEGIYPGALLLHYNGKKWATVSVPYKSTFTLANLAPDGSGGIWIAATTNSGLDQYMYRLQAGHWSRALMPSDSGDSTQVADVALRPGTTSAWAVGDMVPVEGGVPEGVLLSY